MSDGKVDLTEAVVGGAIAGILTGVSAAMAWFGSTKKRMYVRIGIVEEDMKALIALHAKHTTELAVMQACQENTAQQLEEIKDANLAMNNKLDAVLLAIRKNT